MNIFSSLANNKLAVFIAIAGIIAVIVILFFLKKLKKVKEAAFTIKVENGYHPYNIIVKKNRTTRLNFIRYDTAPCTEEVIVPDFAIRRHLPIGNKVGFEITPRHTGEFPFYCASGDHKGKITVID